MIRLLIRRLVCSLAMDEKSRGPAYRRGYEDGRMAERAETDIARRRAEREARDAAALRRVAEERDALRVAALAVTSINDDPLVCSPPPRHAAAIDRLREVVSAGMQR